MVGLGPQRICDAIPASAGFAEMAVLETKSRTPPSPAAVAVAVAVGAGENIC